MRKVQNLGSDEQCKLFLQKCLNMLKYAAQPEFVIQLQTWTSSNFLHISRLFLPCTILGYLRLNRACQLPIFKKIFFGSKKNWFKIKCCDNEPEHKAEIKKVYCSFIKVMSCTEKLWQQKFLRTSSSKQWFLLETNRKNNQKIWNCQLRHFLYVSVILNFWEKSFLLF